MSVCANPTNNALSINFRLSFQCRSFVNKHRLSIQVGAKRAKTCMHCVHLPTELPFCIPPLVVGNPASHFIIIIQFPSSARKGGKRRGHKTFLSNLWDHLVTLSRIIHPAKHLRVAANVVFSLFLFAFAAEGGKAKGRKGEGRENNFRPAFPP